MEDLRTPIMTTKYHSSYLTSGCWSPTRAGRWEHSRLFFWSTELVVVYLTKSCCICCFSCDVSIALYCSHKHAHSDSRYMHGLNCFTQQLGATHLLCPTQPHTRCLLCNAHGRRCGHLGLLLPSERSSLLPQGALSLFVEDFLLVLLLLLLLLRTTAP